MHNYVFITCISKIYMKFQETRVLWETFVLPSFNIPSIQSFGEAAAGQLGNPICSRKMFQRVGDCNSVARRKVVLGGLARCLASVRPDVGWAGSWVVVSWHQVSRSLFLHSVSKVHRETSVLWLVHLFSSKLCMCQLMTPLARRSEIDSWRGHRIFYSLFGLVRPPADFTYDENGHSVNCTVTKGFRVVTHR